WGGRIQLGKGAEQEERRTGAAGHVNLPQSGLHGSHPLAVCRDRKYSEIFPSKLPFVLLCGVRSEVNAHLAFEAGLLGIGSSDRHRAAVDLHHKIAAFGLRELQPEHEVGDNSDLVTLAAMRLQKNICRFFANLAGVL